MGFLGLWTSVIQNNSLYFLMSIVSDLVKVPGTRKVLKRHYPLWEALLN
jgi:hypothetical protein